MRIEGFVYVVTKVDLGDDPECDLSVEPGVYADTQALPSDISAQDVRKAQSHPGEAIFSLRTLSFLTFCRIQ